MENAVLSGYLAELADYLEGNVISRLKDQANIAEDREDHRGAALLRLAASRLNPPPPRYEPPPLDRGPIVRTWPDTGPPLDVISTHEIKEGIRDAALLAEVDAVAAPLDGDLLYSNRPADTAMLRSVTEVEGTGAIVSPLEAVRAAGLLYVVTRLESIVRDLAEFPLHECSACRADIVDGRELNTLKARARAVLDGDKA